MKAERKINRSKYLAVGFITLLIFMLGMSFGIVWDSKRVQYVQEINEQRDLDYQSLQFQYLFASSLEEKESSCGALLVTLEESVKSLAETLNRLTNFEKESTFNNEQYVKLERAYILDNLRYWLFAEKVRKICEKDIVTVLYFHTKYGCGECLDQGTILTHYKTIFGDRLLVYPIDSEIKASEPSIVMIESRYNITTYPTIVIENEKYEGLVGTEELKKLICSSFKTMQPECPMVVVK